MATAGVKNSGDAVGATGHPEGPPFAHRRVVLRRRRGPYEDAYDDEPAFVAGR